MTIEANHATPEVELARSPASISENGGMSTVTATLDRPSSEATTVTVSATPVHPADTYQWVRVDGSSESDIGGATSGTYTLSASDEGKQVKVKVSFTDGDGNAERPLASNAWPSTGSVVAAKRACPTDADWCAEMTVWAQVDEYADWVSGSFGYQRPGSYGSLSDNTFSHRGVDYTVMGITRDVFENRTSGSGDDSIDITVSGRGLPDGTVFTVAGAALTVGAGSSQPRLQVLTYPTARPLRASPSHFVSIGPQEATGIEGKARTAIQRGTTSRSGSNILRDTSSPRNRQ